MCRIAAYIGPAVNVGHVLFSAPHSLERQAYAPREMVQGTINVDGTGVAWWQDEDPVPLRYITTSPPWSDPNLASLAPRWQARTLLATVRSATTGAPTAPGSVPPFEQDGIVGTHSGFLRKFREATAARCLAKLPDDLVGRFEAMSDSLAVFLLAIAARREDPDLPLTGALVGAVSTAARACAEVDAAASLNVVLATADEIVGIRFARGTEPGSLYVHDGTEDGGGVFLASEPLDEESGWDGIPPDHIVRLTAEGVTTMPARIEL
jgi:glutamine amidotransferase